MQRRDRVLRPPLVGDEEGVLLIVTETGADVPTFPAASYALEVSVWEPLESVVVLSEALYGEVVAVAIKTLSTLN